MFFESFFVCDRIFLNKVDSILSLFTFLNKQPNVSTRI